MKNTTLFKNGFPSPVKLIIYVIIISALCFLTCLVSGAQKESSSPSEEITLILPQE